MTLTAQNICVTLGKKPIVEQVSLTAQPGQVTAIVGPNGSGKTTLLRAMTGDVTYQGKVMLGTADISHLQAWELAAMRAVLPQATVLAFPFTVIEVVRIGLHLSNSGEADTIAQSALLRVGLGGYEDRYYQELSGGEQQRAQLARVLAQVWQPFENGHSRWLFLDEPVASLDIGHQLEVMEIMRQFAVQGGGVMTVMHDLNLTAIYADQIIMMADGEVLSSGPPEDVLKNETLSTAYRCNIQINSPPTDGSPFILPTKETALTSNGLNFD